VSLTGSILDADLPPQGIKIARLSTAKVTLPTVFQRYQNTVPAVFQRSSNGVGRSRRHGAWLVSNGWALNYAYFGDRYSSEQASAKIAKRGIWQSDFENPSDWRRKNPRQVWVAPSQHPRAACATKVGATGVAYLG
jgi:hypothetical protein